MNKESFKLISLDQDGTLLNSQRNVEKETIDALKSAASRGYIVVISTGSPFGLISKEQLTDVPITYAITANGSAIYEYQTGKCIWEMCIDKKDNTPIMQFLLEREIHFDIFANGRGYTAQKCRSIIEKLPSSEARKEYLRNGRIWIDDPISFLEVNGISIQKITMNFIGDPGGHYCMRDEAAEYFAKFDELSISSGGYNNLEITKKGINKGVALTWLVEHLQLTLMETVVFGDSLNDLDIIRVAGHGVAMGNAMKRVREIADEITFTNDELGVAKWIERNLLSNGGI